MSPIRNCVHIIKSVYKIVALHPIFFPLFFFSQCFITISESESSQNNNKHRLVVALATALSVLTPNIFDAQLCIMNTQRAHKCTTHTQYQVIVICISGLLKRRLYYISVRKPHKCVYVIHFNTIIT